MVHYYWKVWLRLNFLTKDVDDDYVADVSTSGKTLRNKDIARLFVETGSELQYETVLHILDRFDRLCSKKLQEGYSIQTGVCHLKPRVAGNWPGGVTKFDPKAQRITLTITPAAEMRAALEEVGVEVLGVRKSGIFIGLVTDVETGLTDGTLTPGGQIIITGDKIKVEPCGEPGVGVFITDGASVYELRPLAKNRSKEIIALVPASLAPGAYSLYIASRFNRNYKLLKEIRRIDYATPLIAL